MIKVFTVENFLSFDLPQTISFEATSDNTSESQLIYKIVHPVSGTETRILRMTSLYGANASGKTNLLIAMSDLWNKLYIPFVTKDEDVKYRPFILRGGEATRMNIEFFVDSICYKYTIEFNSKEIIYERLEFNPKGVMSLFYERKYNAEKNIPIVVFGKNSGVDSKVAGVFISNTLNNHTVLSTYSKVSADVPEIEKLRNWIENFIYSIKEDMDINDVVFQMTGSEETKLFLLNTIKKADFNISNIIAEKKDLPEEIVKKINESSVLDEKVKQDFLNKKIDKIVFEHQYEGGVFSLPMGLESAGTFAYIKLVEKLYNIINKSVFIPIDEIEDSLHYDLLVYFLQLFVSNDHKSQMIFTTHDQLILDEDFMRRDMVWFAEKDMKTASTELYSAADFGLHKNVSVYKAYKIGKLGAKPELGSPFINLNGE